MTQFHYKCCSWDVWEEISQRNFSNKCYAYLTFLFLLKVFLLTHIKLYIHFHINRILNINENNIHLNLFWKLTVDFKINLCFTECCLLCFQMGWMPSTWNEMRIHSIAFQLSQHTSWYVSCVYCHWQYLTQYQLNRSWTNTLRLLCWRVDNSFS